MSYDAFESSAEDGSPVEIYEIIAGATSFFYTSAEDDVDPSGSQVYTAVAGMQRASAKAGPGKRNFDFNVELPTSDPFVQQFCIGIIPSNRFRLKVRRYHRDDLPTPETALVFDGYISAADFNEDTYATVLGARTQLSATGRMVPDRTSAAECDHTLFDPLTCKVDKGDPDFSASALPVVSQDGNVLTVSGLAALFADGKMNAGECEIVGGSASRLILDQVGNVLTLMYPFSVTPGSVNVFVGCPHNITACRDDFKDNVLNYGGNAFTSDRNPHRDGIN